MVDVTSCSVSCDIVSLRSERENEVLLVREIDALRRLKYKALSSPSASALQRRPLAAAPDLFCLMIVNREVIWVFLLD